MELTALYRAATLAERLVDAPEARQPHCIEADRPARRLRRWETQPPFDEPDWWARRLASAGLTEARLLALLAEPPDRLAARRPAAPRWVTVLAEAYGRSDSRPEKPISSAGQPFVGFVQPLLRRARDRLVEGLRGIPSDSAARIDADQLYPHLIALLDRILSRTMALELNLGRLRETVPGGTPEERFDAFCARLYDPAERWRLVTEYPALTRRLLTVADQWVTANVVFATRLAHDWPRLAATFAGGSPLGSVAEVTPGLGDPHRGGHTVTEVRFASGARVIYKPRPIAVEACFQEVLAWLNKRGASHPFRTLTYLDRGDYGWAEFVVPEACADAAERHRFYHRQGGLLAAVYLLRGNDLCAENLIAAGEHPILVDVEALCQPELELDDTSVPAAERAAVAAAAASVLRVGMLPMRAWTTVTGRSVDLSGLGGGPGQLTPMAVADVDDSGTDRMRVRLRRRPVDVANNRPVEGGSPLRVLDYLDDILAGFTETYELCARHRDELVATGGPLDAFTGVEVRVLLRSTMEYALIRNTSYHPDVARDGLDTERHLDRLWKGVARRPALAAVVEHERRDLFGNDIPVFTVRTDATDLRASDDQPVGGLVTRTGMDSVRAAVAAFGTEDLRRQRWLIRATLVTMSVDDRGVQYPSYAMPALSEPAEPARLLAGADTIGRHLAGTAYRAEDSAEWLGVLSNRGEDWSLGPLGADLPTGLTGVALFLGHLGDLTGEAHHTALARAALTTALSQLDRGLVPSLGGSAGLGGILYALTQLGTVWQDDRLIDRAVRLAGEVGHVAVHDEQFDFAAGAAGSIAALRALQAVRPCGTVVDAVRACGDRLLSAQRETGSGAAWLPRSMVEEGVADVPLAGFGHGAAGIAWSLLEAAALCGDERYRDAAIAAIAYERDLFRPAAGNWADVRQAFRDSDPDFSAWCHGAAGIGMARALSLPHVAEQAIRDEITTAVDTTLTLGFGMNHSLCHGDVGNLDLLLLAADALGEPRWRAEAKIRMAAIMDSIDESGWITGLPHGIETPGLLVGLAGTGYGMLRMAAPHRVPSVLALAPPDVLPGGSAT